MISVFPVDTGFQNTRQPEHEYHAQLKSWHYKVQMANLNNLRCVYFTYSHNSKNLNLTQKLLQRYLVKVTIISDTTYKQIFFAA